MEEDENFRFTHTSGSQQYKSNGMDQHNIILDYVPENRVSQESYPKTQLTSSADREENN